MRFYNALFLIWFTLLSIGPVAAQLSAEIFQNFPPPNENVREELLIHSPEDTKKYFMAHVDRVGVLVEHAKKQHLEAAMEFFQVPELERRNPERIERLIQEVIKSHDKAKQSELAAEGLFRLLGVPKSELKSPEKESVQTFIDWINENDDSFAREILKGEDANVKKLVLFFEKVGDLVDRRTSPEARIELSIKKAQMASELPDNALQAMLKTEDKRYIEFFRKVAASVEVEVGTLTRNMSYREKSLSPRARCIHSGLAELMSNY